ncbi:KOW domain-containing RNA-binding protein [Clostridium sp. BJN0001]|uniref:KOW domain-containing RNA-binding protein n=1 Tax=Clostridium sp. BJN0001 TaxID=2930219 RepID=UPI001FD324D1|nr:KOW domain-containing RNA-binding protein [Clostridium sp. BJN0001]
MQNNDLIGKVVLSRAGRDENHLYVVIRQIDKDYVLIANGDNKTVGMPKKKKIKHLIFLENTDNEVKSSIVRCDNSTDLKIKRFLKIRGIVKEG